MLTTNPAQTSGGFAGEPASPARSQELPRPEEIDVHIGRRIRTRRRMLGLNQTALGRRIGVTFQQVHKYETGRSAVTAARLYVIARALGVTFEYFYGDLPD